MKSTDVMFTILYLRRYGGGSSTLYFLFFFFFSPFNHSPLRTYIAGVFVVFTYSAGLSEQRVGTRRCTRVVCRKMEIRMTFESTRFAERKMMIDDYNL